MLRYGRQRKSSSPENMWLDDGNVRKKASSELRNDLGCSLTDS
jgi:hypothetical protein